MKVAVIAGRSRSLINFRGPLLQRITALGHEVVALAPADHQTVPKQLAAMGIRLITVPLHRTRLDPFADAKAFGTIVRALRRERPEVVLSYTIKPVIYGSVAARVAGVPNIYSMITGLGHVFIDEERTFRREVFRRCVRSLYRAALSLNRTVFFQNPDDHADFCRWDVLPRGVRSRIVHGSGVDLSRFPASTPSTSPVRFLYMGRLLREKGLLELVEAARVLRAKRCEARVLLLGMLDDHPSAIQRQEVDRWVAEGVVDYGGWVEDVRPHLAACSVYVLPSYREGTPRSVLEALATGRAVVTTDVPGCRETVIDGHNGFLVPARDSAALARAMEGFIDDPALVVTMGARSRALAERKYEVHEVNRGIIEELGLT